jgi:homoserine kinase
MAAWQRVRVRVPASSANLGAGFDVLGLALSLHNEIEVTREGLGVHVTVEGEGAERLQALGAQNLAARAVVGTWRDSLGQNDGVRIRMVNRIPLSRGLGSSAAAAVGGVAAAAALAGASLEPEAALDLAVSLEGHPDNVAAALLGGLTVATLVEGRVRAVELPVPAALRAVAVIPAFPLATAKARKALPAMVPRSDAVFNVGRVALLLAALQTGRLELLREATQDRLHQPYRGSLVPGMVEVLAEGERAGALACYLSGAGPTLLALTGENGSEVGARMAACWKERAGVSAEIRELAIDREGIVVLERE